MKKTYSSPELERVLFLGETLSDVSVVDPSNPAGSGSGNGSVEVSPPVDIIRSNGSNKVF